MPVIDSDFPDLHARLRALADAPAWYIGYSGGLDSTVLLHLLHRWSLRNTAPPLRALHVNHGMQSSADTWAAHCADNCAALAVPLETHTVSVSGGEAGARAARYAVFETCLCEGGVLFLAHHLDDQVETFFLRLMRGAGVAGLAGMPECRALGGGVLARPLLDTPRSEIQRYAQRQRLSYVDDPSNANTAIDRNFLRAEVLPRLGSRWPGYRRAVARAGAHMACADSMLRDALGVPDSVISVTGEPGCPLEALTVQDCDVAAQRLRQWLKLQDCEAPGSASLREFVRQLAASSTDAAPRLDAGSYVLQRYRDAVYRLPPLHEAPPVGSKSLRLGQRLNIAGVGELALVPATSHGLALYAADTPHVAWRSGGERVRLAHRDTSVTLKALLQARQVPPWWRKSVPLLYLGEELLSVGDLALCASSRYRAGPATAGEPLWHLQWERFPGSCD